MAAGLGLIIGLTTSAGAWAAGGGGRVTFDTSAGRFVVELFPGKAPKTVANFLRYVHEGFYDGTIFHRVIPGFVIQGGGYTEHFQQKATHAPIPNEAANGLKNLRGTIAMARTSDPNSATSQFYINLGDNLALDHHADTPAGAGYTVFGRVVEGMDVVDRIAQVPTGAVGPFPSDAPLTAVVIRRVTIATGAGAAAPRHGAHPAPAHGTR
ncbi:MAG: cyclophilin [Chromatiales bacterium 21-64-14]|nr:MAG: cyclophilin [Chromatiales bacterium 21-64-14]